MTASMSNAVTVSPRRMTFLDIAFYPVFVVGSKLTSIRGVNSLPKVVTQLCPEYDLNPRHVDRKSSAVPVAPPKQVHRAQWARSGGLLLTYLLLAH